MAPHQGQGVLVNEADRAARAALAGGDLEQVETAARAGLAASPYHDGLYQLRIQAAHAAGDPARARSLVAERSARMEEDVAPYDRLGRAIP